MEFLQVGKIVNTHALQGEVKVVSNSDFKEERFKKGSQLYIDFNGDHIEVVVATHREHKGADLLKFKYLNSLASISTTLTTSSIYGIRASFWFGRFTTQTSLAPVSKISVISPISSPDVVKVVDIEAKEVIIEVLEGLL